MKSGEEFDSSGSKVGPREVGEGNKKLAGMSRNFSSGKFALLLLLPHPLATSIFTGGNKYYGFENGRKWRQDGTGLDGIN